jgi:hypothetical protein
MRRLIQFFVASLVCSIVVALIFVLVVRVQHAAAWTKCANNCKQIGLAFHNYADTFGHLPGPVREAQDLPAERRISWQLDLTPFMECGHEKRPNPARYWDDPYNVELAMNDQRFYRCPANPNVRDPSGRYLTSYVAISGLGIDAAYLPLTDRRCGVIGYSRKTRLEDITDGTSSTMMVGETAVDDGVWIAGGPATIRGLDQENPPYLGQFGQFYGFHKAGDSWRPGPLTNLTMADASVRGVRLNFSPTTFEALATIAGGEPVDFSASVP